MSTEIVLSLPDRVYEHAARLAELMNVQVSDVLTETIESSLSPLGPSPLDLTPVAELSDKEVLAAAKMRMDDAPGKRLGKLLDRQRAEGFGEDERTEMAALMQIYNECLVRKAQALAEAVRRGLREPLSR